MKKICKIILFILLFIILSGCNSKKEFVKLKTFKGKNSIILLFNRKYKKIVKIQIPINIIIYSSKQEQVSIEYHYSDYRKGIGTLLYTRNLNNNLIRIKNNRFVKLFANKNEYYTLYSTHRLDTILLIQQQFEPYIKKMLAEHKDTLHIGSVQEFKQKHKELFEKLTKNDSISIQFLDGKKLGERVIVPVEW